MMLWQMYLEVIDPIVKIFHVPTMQKHIAYSIQNLKNLDVGTKCALFAIYYSTTLVIPDEDYQKYLHGAKDSQLHK